ADPLGQERRLVEAADERTVEFDDAERRAHMRDGDRRRGAAREVGIEERPEPDVEQLVAVQRVDVPLLAPRLRGEAEAAAAPQRLWLLDRNDLARKAAELFLEQRALALGAADDHALDAGAREHADLVGDERPPS